MAEQFLECPKDPKMKYLRTVCENIFRRNGIRVWCRQCHYFEPSPSKSKINAK